MIRRFFAAALAATLTLSAVQAATTAATDTTQTQLLLKKKKLAAQMKALQDQQAIIDKSLAATKKPVAVKTVSLATASITPVKSKASKPAPVAAAPAAQVARLQPCTSFLGCLFGSKHRRQQVATVQQANFGAYQNAGLSGNTDHKVVTWTETKYPVGSLIVRTPERALYFVSAKNEAIRYSVGVGREGMQWSGNSTIVAKAEWPSWTPPKVMIEREAAKGHIIPPFMEGGPGNPLGARAMYIGGRMYRVHGTNNEASIGGAVSSGCIRMMNADVIDLYDRVKVGAKIYVYQ